MKILLAAKALRLDKTSEGICTSKTIQALTRAGHEVVCLTSEPLEHVSADFFQLPWLGAVRVKHVGHQTGRRMLGSFQRWRESLAASGGSRAYAVRKMDALCTYASGYDSKIWHQVDQWEAALRETAAAEKPDFIYTRAAGGGFEPHIAMLRLGTSIPWVAHYHDPYPSSLYPDPYTHRMPIVSRWQETLHRRIVRSADALTFPSARLLDWVLGGDLKVHRDKGFVVPHVAGELTPPAAPLDAAPLTADGKFTLVHAGTVLGPRDPRPLLRGLSDFIGQDEAKREKVRLIFIGNVHQKHLGTPEWERLAASGNLLHFNRRVDYHRALETSRAAVATVVLEADAAQSPFFPAKLADCLWLGTPILALAAKESVTADILGSGYPLLVQPGDAAGITLALNALWERWRNSDLQPLIPSAAARGPLSESAVGSMMAKVFESAGRGR